MARNEGIYEQKQRIYAKYPVCCNFKSFSARLEERKYFGGGRGGSRDYADGVTAPDGKPFWFYDGAEVGKCPWLGKEDEAFDYASDDDSTPKENTQ